MLTTQPQSQQLPRIEVMVTGKKNYHGVGEDGTRYIAEPGDVVNVTVAQMQAFPKTLVTAKVAKALAYAEAAVKEANAMAAQILAEASRPPSLEFEDEDEGEEVSDETLEQEPEKAVAKSPEKVEKAEVKTVAPTTPVKPAVTAPGK